MDNSIIEEIKYRFNFYDFQETLKLTEEVRPAFINWIANSAEGFSILEEDVRKSKNDIYTPNRCFGNALLFAKENDADYFEGFVRLGGRVIHHGFVVKDGKIIDITRDNRKPDQEESWTIDSQYWGIRIPENHLSKIEEKISDSNYNDPQLITLFESKK